MIRLTVLLYWLGISFLSQSQNVCGLSFVAPPTPFENNPMDAVSEVNANWISVIPYAYTRLGKPIVRHNVSGYQWWGERPEGIRQTINLAHEKGIQVMLKPQVYVPGSWPGALNFEFDKDWIAWETAYKNYIMLYVDIAAELNVKAICIGTEFRESVKARPHFWIDLIKDIRVKYSGFLTYAANWDDYQDVPFWHHLDIIGIDAYFPLSDATTPSVEELNQSWEKIMVRLNAFSVAENKKIVFTEFGYLSVDGTAHKNWELEKNIKSRSINELAQQNAIEALLTTCSKYPCWVGGFLWKWFPNGHGHEGYLERDYTPQGKLAEKKLKELYSIFLK